MRSQRDPAFDRIRGLTSLRLLALQLRDKEATMRTVLSAAVVLSLTLVAACDRRAFPTAPMPFGSSGQSVAPVVVNANRTSNTAGSTRGEQVTFKGSLAGRLTMSSPLTPPLLSNLVEGSGNGTQLGQFTIKIPHVVNTTTRMATGTYEFTAANGDTLTAEFTGQASPTAPGVLTVIDRATITGGTGRFVNATGSFLGDRVFTIATGEITGTFQGTISSVGASKQ